MYVGIGVVWIKVIRLQRTLWNVEGGTSILGAKSPHDPQRPAIASLWGVRQSMEGAS